MRKILSGMRRAIQEYNMIAPHDKIAVGVSGGKDSLALLCALADYRKFSEVPFEVMGVTLDMGFKGTDFSPVARLCEEIGVEYVLKKTDIAHISDTKIKKSLLSLCKNATGSG